MADIDREKLRDLCERATPRPWTAGVTGYGSPYYVYSDDKTGSAICSCRLTYVSRSHDELVANADFIAAARTALPALLDITDAQAAKIVELETLVKDLQVERGELAEHVARSQVTRLHLESERDQLRKQAKEKFITGIRKAAEIAKTTGHPVGCGDGDTYIPGTSSGAALAILSAASALEQKEQG